MPHQHFHWSSRSTKAAVLIFFALFSFKASSIECILDKEALDTALIQQNFTDAARIYSVAGRCGNAEANYSLGVLFSRGLGVSKDEKLAVKYYEAAANSGHIEAQNNLGLMYYLGRGISQDRVLGDMWFQIAARRGHEGAKRNSTTAHEEMSPEEIRRATEMAAKLAIPIKQ